MSNALWNIGFLAQATQPAPEEADAVLPITVSEKLLVALLAIGVICLLIWIVRRILRPHNLSLSGAPGRSNHLTAVHVLLVFLVWQLVGEAALWLLMTIGQGEEEAGILAGVIRQVAGLAAVLIVGHRCFRYGLKRGMGWSLRHWGFDTARGVIALLSVFPICIGLVSLVSFILKAISPDVVRPHGLLDALTDATTGWKCWIVLSAVVLAPLSEEGLFRGLLQSVLRRYLQSPWGAILIASMVFSLFHLSTPQNVPALFALGVVLGYNYERSGRLWPAIVVHMLFNGVMISLQLLA
jgi:membrane protease YdiL (CAAX protease family)